MKVLYLSCFPNEFFKKIIQSGKIQSQAAQKFNHLFVRGFCANGLDVDVLIFCEESEECQEPVVECINKKKVTYYLHKLKGNMIQRRIGRIEYAHEFTKRWARENPDGLVVIDALKPGALEFSREASHRSLKVCTIVTDLIDFLKDDSYSILRRVKSFAYEKEFYRQFRYTDGLVLLTEPMLEKINTRVKKYIVIDGICDTNKLKDVNRELSEENKVVFLYSGALSKQFGLDRLVEGFLSANLSSAELHLYGGGDYALELNKVCREHDNIRYFGVVPNEVMVEKQQEATFLVNPRPIGDEYTKYSFPSKNIEYMCSGRPLITTKLPCISSDYNPYVLFFENDTVEGIAKSLKHYSEMNKSEVDKLGVSARRFVLNEKNCFMQAKKILDMFQ